MIKAICSTICCKKPTVIEPHECIQSPRPNGVNLFVNIPAPAISIMVSPPPAQSEISSESISSKASDYNVSVRIASFRGKDAPMECKIFDSLKDIPEPTSNDSKLSEQVKQVFRDYIESQKGD